MLRPSHHMGAGNHARLSHKKWTTQIRLVKEVFCDALLAAPAGTFKVEDITGLPWGEIDFPEDLARAHEVVLPQLEEIQPLKEEKV